MSYRVHLRSHSTLSLLVAFDVIASRQEKPDSHRCIEENGITTRRALLSAHGGRCCQHTEGVVVSTRRALLSAHGGRCCQHTEGVVVSTRRALLLRPGYKGCIFTQNSFMPLNLIHASLKNCTLVPKTLPGARQGYRPPGALGNSAAIHH